MSWYDIIKLNQVDAVLAIILDWCDTELDWWRELDSKIVEFMGKNPREEGFSEMYSYFHLNAQTNSSVSIFILNPSL